MWVALMEYVMMTQMMLLSDSTMQFLKTPAYESGSLTTPGAMAMTIYQWRRVVQPSLIKHLGISS